MFQICLCQTFQRIWSIISFLRLLDTRLIVSSVLLIAVTEQEVNSYVITVIEVIKPSCFISFVTVEKVIE